MIRHALHQVEAQGRTIQIVERVTSDRYRDSGRSWYRTQRVPIAVVLQTREQTIAFDMQGKRLDQVELSELMSLV